MYESNYLTEEMKEEFLKMLREYPVLWVEGAFNEAMEIYLKEKGLD